MAINKSIRIELLWCSLAEGLSSIPLGKKLCPLYPLAMLLFFFHPFACSSCPERGRDKRMVLRSGGKAGDVRWFWVEKDQASSVFLFSFQPAAYSAPALWFLASGRWCEVSHS